MQQYLKEDLFNKWNPILEHEDLPAIKDAHRKHVTATVLENMVRELGSAAASGSSQKLIEAGPTNAMGYSSSTTGTGPIDTFDPIMISLVRRAMPNLIAYDIAGVQPMTGPTGIIFAMRSRYSGMANTNPENFFNEVNTGFTSFAGTGLPPTYANGVAMGVNANTPGFLANGTMVAVSNNAGASLYNYGKTITTAQAEALGATGVFPEVAFDIEKTTVTAGSRALQGSYSIELAQDLKAIHGLDAETELANIIQGELLAEINRELVRTINVTAVPGAQLDTTTPGIFDLDVDSIGRWSVEKFKGLVFQLERECNQIAKQTRRGKGNIMVCSSDVASALNMAELLDYSPELAIKLAVDDTGNTFAGLLNGRIKVYIDPYTTGQYATVGFKGGNAYDAGLFYCPYVPLQMVRAVDPSTYQPKIAFKTRYGMVANPFAGGGVQGNGTLIQDSNQYYRRILIAHLM
jgi:hypothetical protein